MRATTHLQLPMVAAEKELTRSGQEHLALASCSLFRVLPWTLLRCRQLMSFGLRDFQGYSCISRSRQGSMQAHGAARPVGYARRTFQSL